MKIVAVVGPSGSGKTTLVAGLVRDFKARGLSVAAVKHAPHGFDLDPAGKDSWTYRRAGADGVGLVSDDMTAVIRTTVRPADLATAARAWFPKADVVIIEGGKSVRGIPKVEVAGRGPRDGLLTPAGELLAVVAEDDGPAVPAGVPVFRPGDAAGPAALILRAVEDRMDDIRLEVDGTVIPLNDFVRQFIETTVSSMIGTLKGIPPDPRTITLTIKRGAAAPQR